MSPAPGNTPQRTDLPRHAGDGTDVAEPSRQGTSSAAGDVRISCETHNHSPSLVSGWRPLEMQQYAELIISLPREARHYIKA